MSFKDLYSSLYEGTYLLAAVITILSGTVILWAAFSGAPESPTSPSGSDPQQKAQTFSEVEAEGPESVKANEVDQELHSPPNPTVSPDIYEVKPGSPYVFEGLQTIVTVAFHSVGGEEFATLTVAPPGSEPIVRPFLGAQQDIEFTTLGRAYRLRIFEVDIDESVARFDVSPVN